MGSTWSSNRPPLNKLRLYSETVELFNITKLSRLGKSILYPMYAKAEVATEITICDDLSRPCAMNIRRQVLEARTLHESRKNARSVAATLPIISAFSVRVRPQPSSSNQSHHLHTCREASLQETKKAVMDRVLASNTSRLRCNLPRQIPPGLLPAPRTFLLTSWDCIPANPHRAVSPTAKTITQADG